MLPTIILLILVVVVVRDDPLASDVLSWNNSVNGEFSVASAYSYRLGLDHWSWTDSSFYKAIWQMQVPEKVRCLGFSAWECSCKTQGLRSDIPC